MKKKLKRYVVNFIGVLKRPDMKVLPGHLAFSFVLAIVPIISLIALVTSYFDISLDFVNAFFQNFFSKDVAGLLTPPAFDITVSISVIVALGVSFYVASNGPFAMVRSSNMIYGLNERNWLQRRIKALIMTLFIMILFLFIMAVPVFGDKILLTVTEIGINENVLQVIKVIVEFLNIPLTFLVLFFVIKMIYTMAPDKKIPSHSVNAGALFTAVGWALATFVYSEYIAGKLLRYTALYGGLANIAILMLWFYILAYIFVIGMAFNYREDQTKTGQIVLKDLKYELGLQNLAKQKKEEETAEKTEETKDQ